MEIPTPRVLQLPLEGVLALETVVGIMTDNNVPLEHDIGVALVEKLYWASSMATDQTTSAGADAGTDDSTDPVVPLELTIAEADALLRGLAFTEAMSMEFPWYPLVVDTVHYVGDELVGLWNADVWMQYRSQPS